MLAIADTENDNKEVNAEPMEKQEFKIRLELKSWLMKTKNAVTGKSIPYPFLFRPN